MTTVDGPAIPQSQLRRSDGTILHLPGERWVSRVDPIDAAVLEHAVAPVIDLGCGPGRHAQALAERGLVVLGIDLSAHAVGMARSKGVAVLERSVFEQIPRAHQWGSALLLDGNIGIGGDPVKLLERAATLLRPDGVLLVEVNEHSEPTCMVQLELDGEAGPLFGWAVVGIDDLEGIANQAGLTTAESWILEGRYFAELRLLHPTVS